ncbi:MAG: membrane protein insertase YidC [Treponema sp.]|nr:membrane protein insertase YidC [Treponema sp.]
MERNTILAVVLSTVVLIGSFLIQGFFITKNQQEQATRTTQSQSETETAPDMQQPFTQTPEFTAPTTPQSQQPSQMQQSPQQPTTPFADQQLAAAQGTFIAPEPPIVIDTELFTATLTNQGGDMISFIWKDPKRKNDVELIFSSDADAFRNISGQPTRAFSIALGDHNAAPLNDYFHVNRISDYSVEFYRDYSVPSAVYGTEGRFRLIKRYEFKPAEFMFELRITLEGGSFAQNFDSFGNTYTLSFGPQIGPAFEKLDRYYDTRNYFIYINGKRRNAKVNDFIDSRPSWGAISGKYFAFIAIPHLLQHPQYTFNFSNKAEPGITEASRLNIIRPITQAQRIDDYYRFYLGPKTQETLSIYSTGMSDFNDMREANLLEVASSRGILSPLEKLLKWLLVNFHKVIPNYGICIIILTLLIKIAFFPLTKKGSEATLRMQALAPKIKEIQEKYKGNQQKLQQEMGNFYKQEGYNPLSGCLPMLLQLPIFIAMYQLFNNHFDLRGAEFIPGWIPDLSAPEHIVKFPQGVEILMFTALRGLPFIYVASQLLYGKVTQMPGQQSNNQMKMMLYVMPIVFFFVLYNVPSGLLIYWIFSNLFTLVQQVIINKFIIAKKKKEEQEKPPEPENKIAPGKKKKKKF